MNSLIEVNLFLFIVSLNPLISQQINCGKPNNINRPIIGVLSQEYHDKHHSYIASSYVKYLESAGARVIPIFINKNEEYYERIVNNTNGLLFPGEGQYLNNSGYARAGQSLWKFALKANEEHIYYPVWGTCLGFELLTVLVAEKSLLISCSAEDMAMNLNFDISDPQKSKMFENADQNILNILRTDNVAANYHKMCITRENFNNSRLSEFFNILTTNRDNNSLTFISTIESKNYPIYGTEWHPEKNQFEFALNKEHKNVPHRYNATLISQYMANFFVNQARNNCHQFRNRLEESQALIYNFNPEYSGKNPSSNFQQIYVFSSANSNLCRISFNIILLMILALNYF